jgi:hypothetical protein
MPLQHIGHPTAVGARFRAQGRFGRGVVSLGLAIAGLALTGCGTSTTTADRPTVRPSELTDADGRPCPQELQIGDDPSGHGFGVEEPAKELPSLLEAQEAWVCGYNLVDHPGGTSAGWERTGQPEPVAAGDLPDLQAALNDLALVEPGQNCTADLGPRWMVVYAHDGDLTGVVVDDYGCRHVRLTDNPHSTPPGADEQNGTAGGVLDGGRAVLDALGLGRSS